MYSAASTKEFPGLDLVSAADDAGCIDCLDVDFEYPGAVRSRDGFDNFTSSAAADEYWALEPFYRAASTAQVLAVRGSTIEAISSAGASVATQSTGSTYDQASFVRFASPGNERMYIAVSATAGTAPTSFWRWNGTAFTAISPAGIDPGLVELSPTDNRLAVANFDTSYSKVNFSDAGDPETFGANNYVELTPGDGEPIRAMAAWQGLLFVFKESKFFVFYGNSTDSAGNPVFNYRPVVGVGAAGSRAVAVAPEGVYFVAREGVYLTTGGSPRLVSRPVTPIFTSRPVVNAALSQAAIAYVALTHFSNRLFMAYSTGGGGTTPNDELLVYDAPTDRWSRWSTNANDIAVYRGSTQATLMYARNGANHIATQTAGSALDFASPFTSRYRSGFSDLGTDEEKSVVQAELWGTGTVNYQLSKDFGSLDTATSVVLGTGTNARGVARRGGKAATLFSWQVGASSGAWALHRMVHRVQSKSLPGQKTP